MSAVKRILRYLKGTLNLALKYQQSKNVCDVDDRVSFQQLCASELSNGSSNDRSQLIKKQVSLDLYYKHCAYKVGLIAAEFTHGRQLIVLHMHRRQRRRGHRGPDPANV